MSAEALLSEKQAPPPPAAPTVGRVECLFEVDAGEWDRLVTDLGGSFFHCHAYTLYEAAQANTRPLFVKVHAPGGECVAAATAAVITPRRWPFARYCKEVLFDALPATRDRTPEAVTAALAAVERALRRLGVFRVQVHAYASPLSGQVLPGLGYDLRERHEFYVDLDKPIDQVWDTLRSERRKKIRKAIKAGVRSVEENSPAGLRLLWDLHREALLRRGIEVAPTDEQVERMQRLLLDSGRAKILVSYDGAAPVGALLFATFGTEACSLLSGSSVAGNRCAAPSHANWTMMELASAAGAKTVNIGGASAEAGEGEGQDGLFAFKRDFGATPVPQPAGSKLLPGAGQVLDRVRGWLKRGRRPTVAK